PIVIVILLGSTISRFHGSTISRFNGISHFTFPRCLAHQRKLVAIRVTKLRQPQLHLSSAVNHMRLVLKLNAPRRERFKDSLNIRHLEVDGRAALMRLTLSRHPHQQPNGATLEKRHLRRRSEQKRDAERLAVELNRA